MAQGIDQTFRVGSRLRTRGRTITEADVLAYAGLSGDFLPLHVDEEYARRSSFGGRIVHGPLTFVVAAGLSVMSGVLNPLLAWLGINSMTLSHPVRAGDTLTVDIEVVEARRSRNPERQVVTMRYHVLNQKEQEVMTFDMVFLMQAPEA